MATLTRIELSGGATLHQGETAVATSVAYDEFGNRMGGAVVDLLLNGVFNTRATSDFAGEVTWTWIETGFLGEQIWEVRQAFTTPFNAVVSNGVVFNWVPPGVASYVLLSAAGAPTNPAPGSTYTVFVSVFDQNRILMQGQHVFLLSGINGAPATVFLEGDTNEYGYITFSWIENAELDQYLQAWVGSVPSGPLTLSWRNPPPPPPTPIPACLQLLPAFSVSAPVGTQVAISVLVLDQFGVLCGQPIGGWPVRIGATRVLSDGSVVTLLNVTVNTGPDGYARTNYGAPSTGTDHIIAFADTGTGRFVFSNVGTVNWQPPTCPSGQHWNGAICVANPTPGPGPGPGGATNILLYGGAIVLGLGVSLILFGGK